MIQPGRSTSAAICTACPDLLPHHAADGFTSFKRIPDLVDQNEKIYPYPHFLRGPRGELIFTYRDGRSGNGDQYFNVYDPDAPGGGS